MKLRSLILGVLALLVVSCTGGNDVDISGIKLETKSKNAIIEFKKQYAGKVLLVNFFASWCPPCKAETPYFVDLYEKYKDKNFAIVALSLDASETDAAKYIKEFNVTYPVYMSDSELARSYGVNQIPKNIFIGPDGNVLAVIDGQVAEQQILDFIKKYE